MSEPRPPEPGGTGNPGEGQGQGDVERRSGRDRRRSDRRKLLGIPDVERRSGQDRRTPDERRQADQVNADSLSLGRRLRQPKTIVSLVLPIVLLVLFVRALPGF